MSLMEDKLAQLSPAKRLLLEQRLRGKAIGTTPMPDEGGLPVIVPKPEQWSAPFPLTEIQQAYWIGRRPEFDLGNVAMHVYFELDCEGFDLERFNRAWQTLIQRHQMLRMTILPEGLCQILDEAPNYEIDYTDLGGEAASAKTRIMEDLRSALSHQVLQTDRWPLFDLRAVRHDERRTRLYFSIDGLIADASSLIVVLREMVELYINPFASLPALRLSFRDYVLAEIAMQETEVYKNSLAYWLRRIEDLPEGPDLPLAKAPGAIDHPRFSRRTGRLARESWATLKARIAEAGLTPSGVLLTAFAQTLSQWSRSPRFTLNVTVFNRLPLHPQVDDIVGDFTSLILVPIEAAPQDPFLDQARRVQNELLEGLGHRYVSGVRVLRELARMRGGDVGIPMAVVFTSNLLLNNAAEDTFPFAKLGEFVYGINQTPQVWLDQQVMEEGGALVFHWDTVAELFPEGMVEDMFSGYCRLLEELAAHDTAWHQAVKPLLSRRDLEQRELINTTGEPLTEDTLYDLFSRQAQLHPNNKAVIASDRTLTYGELHDVSTSIAHTLARLGARPNKLIAVVMEKGWEQVAGVMGVVAAGAAYLPIDPESPAERLSWLLENGEVEVALTQSWLDERLQWPAFVRRVCIDTQQFQADRTPLQIRRKPEDLVYVIYTSGSTGEPKGVMIEQRNVLNRVLDVNRRFAIGSEERVIALTALPHDLSVYDIFGSLAAGAAIVMPDRESWRDPAHWAALMKRERVSLWNSVPAFMEMLIEYLENSAEGARTIPDSLRLALLAGDWIPVSLPDRLRALIGGAQVISLGGPTETTIWDICYPVAGVDPAWKSIPYGKPMTNARYHVLDDALRPRPTWAPGSLYIGGAGLARGFWRDERLTAERFILHPVTGERLYRSGDLGRYLPDGNIEFLGREDSQVKIQGNRIELGEIETALRQHPLVHNAAVNVTTNSQDQKRLVAYVVGENQAPPDTEELARFLKTRLPAHMVPQVYVKLDAIPLTRNGKVNRRALPDPPSAEDSPAEVVSLETDSLAGRIAALVARVLNVERIGSEDDFFALGATSIEIVRIANLLEQEIGSRPQINQLVRLNTVAAIRDYYRKHPPEAGQKGIAEVKRQPRGEALLDLQQREEFKHRQLGIRGFRGETESFELEGFELDEDTVRLYTRRHSSRSFGDRRLSAHELGSFLSCLRQISLDGSPKYRWASGGGLYPVQAYLHIKDGRIDGLPAGTYYYHPVQHRIFCLRPGAQIDRTVHFWNNQPIFDSAAFSIFFLADLRAIEPMYGELSMNFCLIEAGIIAHLLESAAAAQQIGLCQVANVNFESIRELFSVDEDHIYLHAMLGGPLKDQPDIRPAALLAVDDWEEGEL